MLAGGAMSVNQYNTRKHCKFRLYIHLIFVVKYRKQILKGAVSDTLKRALTTIESKSNFVIDVMEVDKDHLHIMIKIEPQLSVSQYFRRIKQSTTRIVWSESPALKKQFWKEKTFWSDGYFFCSAGDASTDTIRKYIEEQG
jgi:putative transposase